MYGGVMTVYGACWQDVTEPWGWEPITLFVDRSDAEAEVQRLDGEASESVVHSVQEYTLLGRGE